MQTDHAYFMTTERIGFGIWTDHDLELAIHLWGDARVTRLFDARGKLSVQQVKARLHHEIQLEQTYGIQYWPIFRVDSGEHIGACGLRPYDEKNRVYEIGFHICSAHWGHGYATEAADAVIHHGFSNLNAEGLFAGHNPENKTSRHLLGKLGFTYTHDEFYEPTGLNHPSYIMTRKDWDNSELKKNRSMVLKQTRTTDQNFIKLISMLDRELNRRYGKQQSAYTPHNQMQQIDTAIVGYLEEQPVACGCFRAVDETTIEIKRMFVHQDFRRRGFSKSLLASLETLGAQLGYCHAVLETGKGQPEAIALYTKCGYTRIENYGPYKTLENSVCMKKSIST